MSKIEIRSAAVGVSDKRLTGYVVPWNSESEIIYGEFIESFDRGAFADCINSGSDIRALFEHSNNCLLGRTKSGTLKLEEDNAGLHFDIDVPDNNLGRDLVVSVGRGDITGMSFGFRALEESWNFDVEPPRRTIQKAELYEITVTSLPAYTESDVSVSLRSMEQARSKQNPNGDEHRRLYLSLEELSL